MKPLDDDIDAAILALADRRRKVARIVGEVGELAIARSVNSDVAYDYVASRVEALVEDGCLIAFGDIKEWRHSEVCRPDSVDAGG